MILLAKHHQSNPQGEFPTFLIDVWIVHFTLAESPVYFHEYLVYELCLGPLALAPLGVPLGSGERLGHIGNFIKNQMSFTEKCVKFMKP